MSETIVQQPWPQMMLQRAVSARLKPDYDWSGLGLAGNQRVTLNWHTSYLTKARKEGGRLAHEFMAGAFNSNGRWVTFIVVDTQVYHVAFRTQTPIAR